MSHVDAPEFLTSRLLARAGFEHAFFTRRGGVSEGPFASLSFSLSVGDRPEHVEENLARAARVLGVDRERLYFLSQVHGATSHVLDGAESRERVLAREGDALVSGVSDLACAVRSADCVPVLVADRGSGAVAAIHAGWRGVVGQVVPAGVAALRALIGGQGDLIAAIGPHIELGAFEVSDDVAAALGQASPARDVVVRDGAKPHVDLRRIVRAQLEAAGLERDAVDDVRGCTHSDPDRFFSYRRDGQRSGRHLSAIVPQSA